MILFNIASEKAVRRERRHWAVQPGKHGPDGAVKGAAAAHRPDDRRAEGHGARAHQEHAQRSAPASRGPGEPCQYEARRVLGLLAFAAAIENSRSEANRELKWKVNNKILNFLIIINFVL